MIKHNVWSRLGALVALLIVVSGTGVALAASAPADPPAGGTLAQRIEQRKAEQALALSATDLKRLSSSCVLAQGKVRTIQNATVTIVANHTKVYQQIDAQLWVLTGQLKLAGQDTFALEKEHNVLNEKIAKFQATATNYQQTLDDIVVINCAADVVGFKALVETARTYFTQLRAQAADIRDYTVNTVKPEIAAHATDLQPKSVTSGSN